MQMVEDDEYTRARPHPFIHSTSYTSQSTLLDLTLYRHRLVQSILLHSIWTYPQQQTENIKHLRSASRGGHHRSCPALLCACPHNNITPYLTIPTPPPLLVFLMPSQRCSGSHHSKQVGRETSNGPIARSTSGMRGQDEPATQVSSTETRVDEVDREDVLKGMVGWNFWVC
jgi:hypothetical protein